MCDQSSDPTQHDKARAPAAARDLRPCGHPKDSEYCACQKVKREPITPEEAWLLLSRSQ